MSPVKSLQALRRTTFVLAMVTASSLATAKTGPGDAALQIKIIDLRGQLRMAILDNHPAADREALIKQIADAEVEYFNRRDRCVAHVRKALDAAQHQPLAALYLGGLR